MQGESEARVTGSICDAIRRHLPFVIHPSEQLLLEAVLDPTGSDACDRTETHLVECQSCANRFNELQAFVDGVNAETALSLDKTVSTVPLSTQRERIMRRVEIDTRRHSARVLRFPGGVIPTFATVNRARRWFIATAAAGILVGVTIGQLVHLHPEPATNIPLTVTRTPNPGPLSSTVTSTLAPDEQFMEELELALANPRISELAALDEMTPRIREVAINIR